MDGWWDEIQWFAIALLYTWLEGFLSHPQISAPIMILSSMYHNLYQEDRFMYLKGNRKGEGKASPSEKAKAVPGIRAES